MFYSKLLNYQRLKCKKQVSEDRIPVKPSTATQSEKKVPHIICNNHEIWTVIGCNRPLLSIPWGSRTTTWCDFSVTLEPSSWAAQP